MRTASVLTALLLLLGVVEASLAETSTLLPDFEIGGDGSLFRPEVVVEGPGDQVYILDSGNHRVVVADNEGRVVREFGGIGSQRGRLLGPSGMDVDEDGNVIVADLGNKRVQVFGPDGVVVSVFQADEGISDVVAVGNGEYLMSRSFNRGRALFYRLRYDGSLVEFVGERIGTQEVIGFQVSLNTYRGSLVGQDLMVAFSNLSRVMVIRESGEQEWIDVSTPQTRKVHQDFHRNALGTTERAEVCERIDATTLFEDLRAACGDSIRLYTTYLAGVGGFDGRLFALTNGVLHEIDASGVPSASFELRGRDGSEAYSHRMSISEGGNCYTVDSFHHHIVRRYSLAESNEFGAGTRPSAGSHESSTGE